MSKYQQLYRIITRAGSVNVDKFDEAVRTFRDHVTNNPNDYIEVWDIADGKTNWAVKMWSFDPMVRRTES